MQERTALPSTCTVHAPHCAMPQPYLVPVRPTCSRIAHSRGVLGLTSTSMELPLIVKRTIAFPPPNSRAGHLCHRAPQGQRPRVERCRATIAPYDARASWLRDVYGP